MSNNKQITAVEELVEKVESISNDKSLTKEESIRLYNQAIKKAKEMEKEKQKYFFDCGRQYQLTGEGTFNEVYNETYGGNK
jgi:hypothetical protein